LIEETIISPIFSRRAVTCLLAVCLSALGASCDTNHTMESPTSPSASTARNLSIDDLVTSASVLDRNGTRLAGAAPLSNGGPRITATGNQRVVNGGTVNVAINADVPFDTVFMYVAAKTDGVSTETPGSVGGYYQVALGSPQTATTVLLTFPFTFAIGEFDLEFAVASGGAVGPYVGLTTRVTAVGVGDVQVTLSWDADSDTDLHVVDPAGEEIFYAHRRSASGGPLDLDSNAGCTIDGVRNENITWPVGRAPRGHYIVRVDYWDSCGVAQTNYTVRVNNSGSTQLVSGFFTGLGDAGGQGSGRLITTFDRSTGPTSQTFDVTISGPADGPPKVKIVPRRVR